jgi:DNA-binding transcriptional LysR family regulator
VKLFGEKVFPVCSPKLLKKLPLKKPEDLRNHVLLQYHDPDVRHPWLHWNTWLEVAGVADLRPAGRLSFSGYEQIIPAAVAGHGVALGRSPLVKDLMASRELVAPFKNQADPARAYFVIVAKQASPRPEVAEFVSWLRAEAVREEAPA